MEFFTILAHKVCVDSDLPKYIELYKKKLVLVDDYTKKYNEFQTKITTMNELIAFVENLKNFVVNEYNLIADKMIDILKNNQIYNKPKSEMMSSNNSVNQFEKLILSINKQIEDYLNSMNVQFDDIKVQGMSDIKKDISKTINATAQTFQTQIQDVVYKGSMLIIDEIFLYCLGILILHNKISGTVLDNLQKEKANTIMNNLEQIQDEGTKKSQLMLALQSNVISKDVHSKVLDCIFDDKDLEEYIKLVKFIGYEDTVLELCQSKISDLYNITDKYVKLINLIDEKYMESLRLKEERTNQSISKNIYKFSNTETICFNKDCQFLFDLFVNASSSIGKLLTQDGVNCHLVVKRSFSLLRMTPPTILDINIKQKDENLSEVTISTLAKFGAILGTPLVWTNKILKMVRQKI